MSIENNYTHIVISKWTPIGDKDNKVERTVRITSSVNRDEEAIMSNNNNGHYEESEMGNVHHDYAYGSMMEGGNGFTRLANKRDEFNMKLGHRDQHTQVGQNPFLAGESYLQHLNVQESFLRPQNTNMILSKNNE